jgi:hypothetical protein
MAVSGVHLNNRADGGTARGVRASRRSAAQRGQLAVAQQSGGAIDSAETGLAQIDWRTTHARDGPGRNYSQAQGGGNNEVPGDGANGLLLHDVL